ncbi:MAG TPA: DUF5657 family protein [Patescibacteria group bacterium]|nr:DUF5657 family protein [Patescibacteria group bacterium]
MNSAFQFVFDPNSAFIFSSTFLLWLLKILALVGFGVYVVFALVMVRQISLMTRTLKTGLELFMTVLGLAHLVFAVLVWFFVFLILP